MLAEGELPASKARARVSSKGRMQGPAAVDQQQQQNSHRDKHKAVVLPPPARSSGRTTAAGSSGGGEGAAVMARSTRQQQTLVQGDTQDQPQPVHNTRRRAGSLVKSLPSRTRTKATPPPQGSQSAQSSPKQAAAESHNTRFAQSRRPAGAAAATTAASTSQSPAPLVLPDLPPAPVESVKPAPAPAAPSFSMPDNAPPGYRPASMRPPLSRIPAFPLVDSYVPDTTSSDRRHPRQLIPDQLGFPTLEMEDKVRKEDREDKLLMATCAVLHAFENRALCPKEVAEVMLERNWLKNACVRPLSSRVCRADTASLTQRDDSLCARLDLHSLARLSRIRRPTTLHPSPRPVRARRRPHGRRSARGRSSRRTTTGRQARHAVVP